MSRALALKLVERPPAFYREVELWSGAVTRDAHSLHQLINYPQGAPPEFFGHFISEYSKPGEVVLDPFCGAGTCALEAGLLGRYALLCDNNPLAVRLSEAKLWPADLTEVMLAMQTANLSRPISSASYNDCFEPFFEINTFRELVNLRRYCQERQDRVARFIEVVAMGLLHGYSAGYFSAYSPPQVALSPVEQADLNARRCQEPDYRAVVPRILKKTAAVMRDGLPSVLRKMANDSEVVQADARNLGHIQSESASLVVTAPPLPGSINQTQNLWLRLWFAGIPLRELRSSEETERLDVQSWLTFMNEALVELARVVRPGGRAVLAVDQIVTGGSSVRLDQELVNLVDENLDNFWSVEGVLRNRPSTDAVRRSERTSGRDQMVVLRRW